MLRHLAAWPGTATGSAVRLALASGLLWLLWGPAVGGAAAAVSALVVAWAFRGG